MKVRRDRLSGTNITSARFDRHYTARDFLYNTTDSNIAEITEDRDVTRIIHATNFGVARCIVGGHRTTTASFLLAAVIRRLPVDATEHRFLHLPS